MGSCYGDRSVQQTSANITRAYPSHRTAGLSRVGPGGGGGSKPNSFLSSNANEIRPSVSFVSMDRNEYVQNIYTDE